MWITSSRILPIIMLVVIPFSVMILAIALSAFVPIAETKLLENFRYTFSYLHLISAISLVYALFFIKFDNIKKRGFLNVMVEKDYVRRILFIEIPILIFATLYSISYLLPDSLYSVIGGRLFNYLYLITFDLDISVSVYFPEAGWTIPHHISRYFAPLLFNGLMTNLGFSVTAGIIWMILVTARKELGYHLAKTLFQTTTQEKDSSKKAEYLIKATKLYDKYLRRTKP